MQPRYRSFLPLVPIVGLVLFLGCNNGGAGVSNSVSLPKGNVAPTATITGYSPADAPLVRYKPYGFTATATDPDIGDSISKYEWDFGDGTPRVSTTTGAVAHVFNAAGSGADGTLQVQVRAYDSSNMAGPFASLTVSVNSADSPITPTFQSPASAVTLQADGAGGVHLTYAIKVVSTSAGTIGLSNVNFNPGDSLATIVSSQSVGGGVFSYVVNYNGSSIPSTRKANPTVQVIDSIGVSSALVNGPLVTINTLSSANHAPVITMTAIPRIVAGANSTWQNVAIDFRASATDADGDTMTYSWNFGDGGAGDVPPTQAGSALSQTHAFAAAGIYPVVFTADDSRTGGIKSISLNLNILPNTAPALSVAQNPAGNPYANVPVAFTATTSDLNGDAVNVSWDFGDTSPIVLGSSVVHAFQVSGITLVKAIADDGKGGLTTQTLTITVLANHPPVSSVSTPAANLYQNKPYTFTANAIDADVGDTITQYQWDFGDGTGIQTAATATLSHTYASTFTGTALVMVRAVDNHGSLGDFSPAVPFPVVLTPLPVITFLSPGATSLNVDLNGTVTQAFSFTASNPRAGSPGVTDPIPTANITFLPNDAGATITTKVSNGGGRYTYTVQYSGASVAGTRTATPLAYATDSVGIQGLPTSGPAITLNTLGANTAPAITLTNPATDNTVAWTSKPFILGFSLQDANNDPVVYTVDWGDGLPTTSGAPVGDFVAGVPVTVSHTYADAFTAGFQSVPITVTATDNRSTNSTAVPKTRLVTVTFNALPTASITSPQDSGSAPTGYFPTTLPSNTVVIPLDGKLSFVGASTLPGSQDGVSTAWSFPGGVPSTAAGNTPNDIIFTGPLGVITPTTVTYTVTDAFGRTATAIKHVLIDGINTQHFNLSFQYRLKSDNNANSTLSLVTIPDNGLGAPARIFQDGLSNTYRVASPVTGSTASVSIPVRSDLPFYVEIPGFGGDATRYLMRIPNAPTGPYADPTLVAPVSSGSSTFSFSAQAPWDPTLKIVTAQGFAAESLTAPQRKLNGYTDMVLGPTPINNRWWDRLSVPLNDVTGAIPWTSSNSFVGQLSGIPAYQLFAEWPTIMLARATADLGNNLSDPNRELVADPTGTAGSNGELGFVLDYGKYSGDTQPSETFAAFSMQTFRVPGGVTDPYQLSPGWQNPTTELNSTFSDPHAGLNPVPVDVAVPTFLNNLVYSSPGSTPLAGGIQNLPLPYDPNDPDRIPLAASTTRGYGGIRQVFAYSEYLWSTVWARPLVLNSARPSFNTWLAGFPYFRFSNPTAWPKASGISPDNSSFDLTVHGGGVFDGSAPVGLAPGVPSTTGVGRFFWTAFTPFYDGDASSGAAIARTWLADESTKQPPLTFSGIVKGDATVALGFMTPQDTIVDKRGRNANGSLSGSLLGGYRVTWYNPTKDASSNPVPPNFWVVELKDATGTKHFMLPGSYPTGTQSKTDLIMTDARTFLPSGHAPLDGPVLPGDTVAPGYCWFDIPFELRPAPGAVTLTVFAVKSILKNHPVNNPPAVVARPLNRPDWMDAIKTATATMKMLTSSGADLTYAYKIPFNFAWDIVVASGPQTLVAP